MTTDCQQSTEQLLLYAAGRLTVVVHDGSVDGITTTRVPVIYCLHERDFINAVPRRRRPVRSVRIQVLVAMVTFGHRPRNRVVLGKIDADHVAALHPDAIFWIQGEAAVTDPQRYGLRLADELVPILVRSRRSPDLQMNDLGSSAACRVDVPGNHVTALADSLRRINNENRSLDAVLFLAPLSLVSDIVHRLHICTYR